MRRTLHSAARGSRRGFTMVEVLIASALLGFSLIVMFGFHSQALRANMNARRLTDCTYLAQTQMERLMSMDWTATALRPDELEDGGASSDIAPMYEPLEWPAAPVKVNSLNSAVPTGISPALYTITWDVQDMDLNDTWVRLRVRCTYEDVTFGGAHGTTISSYRYRDS